MFKRINYILCFVAVLILGTGCSMLKVEPTRAGCTCIDGQGKYGYIQGVKGEAKGCYVYKGADIKAKITCNMNVQEILIDDKLYRD